MSLRDPTLERAIYERDLIQKHCNTTKAMPYWQHGMLLLLKFNMRVDRLSPGGREASRQLPDV